MNILLSVLILLTALPLFISFSKGLSFFYFILMLGIGIAISLIDVPIMVYMQTEVPTEVRARVLSVAMSIVKLVLPFGLLLSGLLIERMPIVYIIIMGAGITATTAFCMRNM
jgi:predicted MFS family arabinose efflux permease